MWCGQVSSSGRAEYALCTGCVPPGNVNLARKERTNLKKKEVQPCHPRYAERGNQNNVCGVQLTQLHACVMHQQWMPCVTS
jgi:hypothetical protein